jgi:hypothetical protein
MHPQQSVKVVGEAVTRLLAANGRVPILDLAADMKVCGSVLCCTPWQLT